jgi:hypothetical protein
MNKKNSYYILVIAIGLITFSYLSCNRTSPDSLRIVGINNDRPLIVDIADHGIEVTPGTNDTNYDAIHWAPDQVVPVELSYVEIGLGLPTYPTTYTARLTDYKINFSNVHLVPTDTNWHLNSVSGAMDVEVPSSPEGGRAVTANIKVIPQEWMIMYFNDLSLGVELKATVIVNGYEELTHHTISDTGAFTIDIADYWDDPFTFGSK